MCEFALTVKTFATNKVPDCFRLYYYALKAATLKLQYLLCIYVLWKKAATYRTAQNIPL